MERQLKEQKIMMSITPRIRLGVVAVLPLLSAVAVAACSDSASDATNTGGDNNSAPTSGPTSGTTGSASATTGTTGATGTAGPTTNASGSGSGSGTTTGSASATSAGPAGPTGSTTSPSTTSTTGDTGGTDTSGTDTSGPTTVSTTDTGTTGGSGGATSGDTSGGTTTGGGPTFHIFMLMGQSNMAGVANKEASDNNTDERLKVWGGCNQPAGQWNTANPPLNDCPGEKGWNLSTSVDPGIWFGKTLLESLPEGDTIGLVGTAESGESITTFIAGGSHHQMILNKIAAVKDAGRFAGVIFHQGESDCNSGSWPGQVVQLYNEVKEAWGVDYDVPFILGEIPAGNAGCFSHNDKVHQAADQLPVGAWISQEGTAIMDQYHFDHPSVVLMGTRYGEKMIEMLGW